MVSTIISLFVGHIVSPRSWKEVVKDIVLSGVHQDIATGSELAQVMASSNLLDAWDMINELHTKLFDGRSFVARAYDDLGIFTQFIRSISLWRLRCLLQNGYEMETLKPSTCAYSGYKSIRYTNNQKYATRVRRWHGALCGQYTGWKYSPLCVSTLPPGSSSCFTTITHTFFFIHEEL